ncbi:MAG: nucleotidyltransferase family protein [Alphaproteobacteria bacterium]
MILPCMVMAAGLGLRMRPMSDLPKPLVPVAGKPLIDYTLDWLAAAGIQDAVVNTHYQADTLEAHLAKRNTPKIHISHEPILLETGGGIKKALPLLGDGLFFSTNSDVICIDGKQPALHHVQEAQAVMNVDAVLLLHPVEKAIGYQGKGDFFLDNDGIITRRGESLTAPYVFTGVQILHAKLFEDVPEGAFSLNVLYNRLMQKDGKPHIRGIVHEGNWLHVGDPEGVRLATSFLQTTR